MRTPYEQFPVAIEAKLTGIITRIEATAALPAGRETYLVSPITCRRDQTVAELQALLIEPGTHLVVVLDRDDGQVIGLVTLHDLLRAEAALVDKAAGEL